MVNPILSPSLSCLSFSNASLTVSVTLTLRSSARGKKELL